MKIKWFVIGFIVLILVAGFIVFFLMGHKVKELAKQDFRIADIANLPDGIYRGNASAILVTAQAEVTVRAGRIQEIKLLKHSHGPGYGADALCRAIVEANSPDVDGISGATLSSLVVKTAVVDALQDDHIHETDTTEEGRCPHAY